MRIGIVVTLTLLASLANAEVNFNRDVRPILSDRCFHCHGPDEHERKANLRLDLAEGPDGAYRVRKGLAGIKPGDLQASAVWRRISTDDEDDVMPPLDSHKKQLTESERLAIKNWILAGAKYDRFWAFKAPEKTSAPATKWGRNAIDGYVAASLAEAKLKPNAAADKRTLIRRLSFDLTGLPPTLEEIDAFLADNAPDAYEKVVDRLLASPAYGEHFARYWADLVRLADTNGMHKDFFRDFSPYRDWTIRAFNNNQPFNTFIRDQVAGDLLPDATQDQLIASGFNRMHLIIDKGTALPEESLHKNVLDRVEAFSTAFLGLTVQCAQCHDHKYDPISQKEFYRLYAFFNNFAGNPETVSGRGPAGGVQAPFIHVRPPESDTHLTELDEKIARLKAEAGSDWYGMAAPAAPWLWEPKKSAAKELHFKTTLTLAAKPTKATVRYVANQNFEVWINGQSVGKRSGLKNGVIAQVDQLLKAGDNEVRATVTTGQRGFNFELYAEVNGEKVSLLAGKHWQMKSDLDNDWRAAHEEFPAGSYTHWAASTRPMPDEAADAARRELAKLEDERKRLLDNTSVKAMVMKEREPPRPAHLLNRGAYDDPREEVQRGTPAILPPLAPVDPARPTRLDLAQWLVSPDHPLTARVAVNRFWQYLFGVGIVKTSEDFGAQGEWPKHPELLDYLAIRFVESGWDVKALLREIVTSETYRQSSDTTPDAIAADPENRLLARGSRYRLDAEALRDQMLFVSGKLNTTMYGRSVKPPQPAGLWASVTMTNERFKPSAGDAVYRRSLYTFWKRAMPPPQMTILNAPSREYCVSRRERTNTPLQALLLLNEPEYFNLARDAAERVLAETDGNRQKAIPRLYERLTSQTPSAARTQQLVGALEEFDAYYRAHPELAAAISPKPGVPAWTMLTHSLINLELTKVRR